MLWLFMYQSKVYYTLKLLFLTSYPQGATLRDLLWDPCASPPMDNSTLGSIVRSLGFNSIYRNTYFNPLCIY
jgi:hypothetical protein